ncbi:MAG: hypothetical protein LC111_08310 [Bacteroidia bacterium]|nr:hypothetical protein [Bacteroidia bacterium]
MSRFCLHILSQKFMKIRHFGTLSEKLKPIRSKTQFAQGIIIMPNT